MHPFTIVSLRDMLRINAKPFVAASDLIGQLIIAVLDPRAVAFHPEFASYLSGILDELIVQLDTLGLQMTKASAERLHSHVNSPDVTPIQCRDYVIQLRDRLPDELETTYLLALSRTQVAKYDPVSPLFGESVENAFPSASPEIAEAGKCMALERWTASVMHLMRALEPALLALQAAVKVDISKEQWSQILNQIEAKIKTINKGNAPAGDEQWYSEVAAQFIFLKNAWRNYAMHINERYDEERAQEVFDGTRAVMRHLATRLSE